MTRSHEQTLESAMCIWEYVNEQSTSGEWPQLKRLREDFGTPTLRYCCGQIAERVSEAFQIAEKYAGGFYDDPFDWEFVPNFLRLALKIRKADFTLTDNWKDHARMLGIVKRIDNDHIS